jgi:hypothetical protein
MEPTRRHWILYVYTTRQASVLQVQVHGTNLLYNVVVAELTKFGVTPSQASTRTSTKYSQGGPVHRTSRGSYVCTVRTAYIRTTGAAAVDSVPSTCRAPLRRGPVKPSWEPSSSPPLAATTNLAVPTGNSARRRRRQAWR